MLDGSICSRVITPLSPARGVGGEASARGVGGEAFLQQRKRPLAVVAEHGVVDARHHRRIVGQRWRQGYVVCLKLTGSVGKVKLVEHRVRPVGGQCRPVLSPETAPLLKEAPQVGTLGQGIAVYGLVDTVAAHLVVALAHGRHVDTLAGLQGDVPVVLGHTGNHVVMAQVPSLAYVRVLYPDITVLLGKGHLRHGVLHEDAGMGLAVYVHNLALVGDEVLHGQRR